MKSSANIAACSLLAVAGLLGAACGPGGGSTEAGAPAVLVVEPELLAFAADEDSQTLLVKNIGGSTLKYDLEVSASSSNVVWLQVAPESGAVEAGGLATIVVSIVNRDKLLPGIYSGAIDVVGEGLDVKKVDVTLEVGQPILSVEPSDVLDFGTDGKNRNLIFKNLGAGRLQYALNLPPGGWLTTEAPLQNEILPNEPQTVSLTVARESVPWYGDKSDEIVVTSNGLDDAGHSSTLKIEVRVFIDAACKVDGDCIKEGYFCDKSVGGGECTPRLALGSSCTAHSQCKSAICDDDVCCDAVCEGSCRSCALAQALGTCTDLPKGTACDDGVNCTQDDACDAGECVPGPVMDCTQLDSECSTGKCVEETGECEQEIAAGKCLIEGDCYGDGDVSPDVQCLECDAGDSQAEWSVSKGRCYIDNVCYKLKETTGAKGCELCDPSNPFQPSVADDGEPCDSDAEDCTDDLCQQGKCTHVPNDANACNDAQDCTAGDACQDGVCKGLTYVCDDGLACTDDLCTGEPEGCEFPVQPGFCLVDGVCYVAGAVGPASLGCSLCIPGKDSAVFLPVEDGMPCSDNNLCTLGDACAQGVCQGQPMICDDQLFCTQDSCVQVSGQCAAAIIAGWCLIDGACREAGASPGGPDGDCLHCAPNIDSEKWTVHAEGGACDDLSPCSAESLCTAGQCVPKGPLCDDGYACTTDLCNADNACEHSLVPGFCFIDDGCVAAGTPEEGKLGCSLCQPTVDGYGWSPAPVDTPCNDQNPCTLVDVCKEGICIGQAKSCDDGLFCTDDACHPATGECSNVRQEDFCLIGGKCKEVASSPVGQDAFCLVCDPAKSPEAWLPANEGKPCDDLSQCTTQSVCDDGECIGMGPLCAGDNECTVGKCEDDVCVFDNKPEQTPCTSDGIGCTGDVCLDGACKHPVKAGKCAIDGDCYDLGQSHPETTCMVCAADNPTAWTPAKEGVACSDAKWCTVSDACVGGVCVGLPRDCGDSQCATAECLEETDVCKVSDLKDGVACDDEDPCSELDVCAGGQCAGLLKDCSGIVAGETCLQAWCDPESFPEPGKCKTKNLPESTECDDALYCTVGEVCDAAGKCGNGIPRDCDKFGGCFSGSCNEDADECLPELLPNGTACNADDNGCTDKDQCQTGICKPGSTPSCANVADTCNTGSCKSLGPDTYSCQATPKGQGVPCDDGKFCSDGEVCNGTGACGGGLPKDCSAVIAGQDCKVANCDENLKKCVVSTAQDGWFCNDDDSCTLEDTCKNGLCVGAMSGCSQRQLNMYSVGSEGQGFPYIPKLAHLGQGATIFIYRSWDLGLSSRIVDAEGSISWTPVTPTYGEDFPTFSGANCFAEITQAGLAASATGDWLVAMGYRYGKAGKGTFPVNNERVVKYRLSFTAFNRKMEQVKTWTDLWSGTVYDQKHDWQPTCADLPDKGVGYPDDALEAFAFADGAYGILVKVEDGIPQYYPVSASFTVGSQIAVGIAQMYRISGCVLANGNIALVWWNNGYAGVGVVDRNMSWKSGQDFVAQNSQDPGHQWFPRCTALPNGRFLVAFNTTYDSGPGHFYVQVYNSDNSKYGGMIQVVNGNSSYHGMAPGVFSDSGWVATWQQLGLDSDKFGIGARIYSKSNSPLTNSFLVNDSETGDQYWAFVQPYGDQWISIWANRDASKKHDYFFKRFTKAGADSAGAPERRLARESAGNQTNGAVAATDAGFVAVWESDSLDGNAGGIGARLFAPDGAPASQDILINKTVAGYQSEPAVAYRSTEDRFLVVWSSDGQIADNDVFGRLYDANGQPLTGEIQINQTTPGEQSQPSVAAVQGGFVAAWTSEAGGEGDVYARTFDPSGTPLGGEFLVNQTVGGVQAMPRLLSLGEGSSTFIASWHSTSGMAGLYGRRMKADGTPDADEKTIEGVGNLTDYSLDRHSGGTIAACWRASTASCRLLDSQLLQVGSAFSVGPNTTGAPAVVVRAADRLWVFRDDINLDSSGRGVMRDELDAAGKRLTFPILANWHLPADQTSAFATLLPASDNVLIGWTSANQDGSGQGLYFRILD